MNRILQTIKFIVKNVDWGAIPRSPIWFFSMHLPYMLICASHIMATGSLNYKNPHFNTKVYDGFTSNDFKRGRLIQFLGDIKAIKRPYSYDDDVDGRGYFVSYIEDDE